MSSKLGSWLLGVLVAACGRSPYAGYKQLADDVHLRHLVIGDGERLATDSDSIQLRLRMAVPGASPGSLWSTQQWYRAGDLRRGAMVAVLRRLHDGDSISVIARAAAWPWEALAGTASLAVDTQMVRCEIALMGMRTAAEQRRFAERMRQEDPQGYERRLIAAYLAADGASWSAWGTSDLRYRIQGVPSDTARVRAGDHVIVHWKGRRLEDGRPFDETDARTGFSWRFGDPDQVMPGLEAAVSLMRPGQRGTFIIPSSLAFGDRGIAGVLEPNAPVIYEVRFISAQRALQAHR
jgi:FKBP-type peptidyl-prolyl cis-trans isomerase